MSPERTKTRRIIRTQPIILTRSETSGTVRDKGLLFISMYPKDFYMILKWIGRELPLLPFNLSLIFTNRNLIKYRRGLHPDFELFGVVPKTISVSKVRMPHHKGLRSCDINYCTIRGFRKERSDETPYKR